MEKFQEMKLEPYGLAPQHYKMLRTLHQIGTEGIAVYALRKMLLNPKSDISRLVAKVEKMGLVMRTASESDKRKVHITITQKGIDLLGDIDRRKNDFWLDVNDVTEEENVQLYNLLQKLVHGFYKQLPKRKNR